MNTIIENEEFTRNVIFLEDMGKVVAVFPFFHQIDDDAFDTLVDTMPETELLSTIEKKEDLCLIYEDVFGWGWISKKLITNLSLSSRKHYKKLETKLIDIKFIKRAFILNEDINV